MSTQAGLFSRSQSSARAIPLVGVSVYAVVSGASSAVTLRQRFRNTESVPIEAVYVFPLPSDAALHGFTAERDGVRIEGRIEPRDKAFEVYDDALAEGHGAFLVDQERPNVFTVSVGNLAPGGEVTLELRWVAALDVEGEAFRFMLPTTVSPRYVPRAPLPEVGQPDHERINPERWVSVPYGLTLGVELTGPITRVESPSHPIRTTFPTPSSPHLKVELAHDEVALDRDFVLVLTPATKAPVLSVSRLKADRFLELSFIPTMEPEARGIDIVFVVDCSGSMDGESIEQARRALALCVRALDERDTFDIVRFGSHHESLFGVATPFSQDSLTRATTFIEGTTASLGGTEILAPLQAIYQRPRTRSSNILLLTDGQVSNESAVIALTEAHRHTTRVFSFGIGSGVSEHLVKEVARTSRGRSEFIAPGERIEPKVLRQFGRVRSPLIEDLAIDWGTLVVDMAPRELPTLFSGEPLVVRAQVLGGTPSGEVTLVAGGQRFGIALTADMLQAAWKGPSSTLWARARIRELEAGSGRRGSAQERGGTSRDQRAERALVEVAQRHSLMSSATSFVAVEFRADQARTFNPELRKVPIALTAGWGGAGRGGVAAAAPAAQSGGAPMVRKRAAASMDFMPADPAPAARRARLMPEPEFDAYLVADSEPAPCRRAAPPSPASAPAAPAPDKVYAILLLQQVDGSFPVAVLALLGVERSRLATLISQHGERATFTTLVLHVLDRDHRDRKDEWRAAAEKARRFLEGHEPIDVGELFA